MRNNNSGSFAASIRKVTDEAIMEYIRHQDGARPGCGGDNFQVAKSWAKDFSPKLTKHPNLPAFSR